MTIITEKCQKWQHLITKCHRLITLAVTPNSHRQVSKDLQVDSSLLALIDCFKQFTGIDITDGKSDEDMFEYLTKFRLMIGSLVINVFSVLYNDIFVQYDCHLMFENGDINNNEDLNKWKMIHRLFGTEGCYNLNIQRKVHKYLVPIVTYLDDLLG